MYKRRKPSPATKDESVRGGKAKGYKPKVHSNRMQLISSKMIPHTPQDTEMEDQDEKPITRDSLELPEILFPNPNVK